MKLEPYINLGLLVKCGVPKHSDNDDYGNKVKIETGSKIPIWRTFHVIQHMHTANWPLKYSTQIILLNCMYRYILRA